VRRLAWRAAAALALPAAAGCGGGTMSFTDFVDSYPAAFCHLRVLCGDFPDQASCLPEEQRPHYFDTLRQDVASGKISYDGARGAACIQGLSGLPACSGSAFAAHDPYPACDVVFTGTVAAGDPCFFHEECAAGGACHLDDPICNSRVACCAGTCQAVPPPAGAGGDCTSPLQRCVPGTICTADQVGNGSTCLTAVGVGAACGSSPCAYPLYCDPDSQTCQAPVGTNGPCNPALAGQDCDDQNDRCDFTTHACTRRLSPGEVCVASAVGCAIYASCDATTGTCVTWPAAGEACDPSGSGSPCLNGSCDAATATCTLPPAVPACTAG
jgi:hypothetical protein